MGLPFTQTGAATYYQYFVTTLGDLWANVPTPIQMSDGSQFMVSSVDVSAHFVNGKPIYDVKYNGDAGMWNPDGSPRLPLCPQ